MVSRDDMSSVMSARLVSPITIDDDAVGGANMVVVEVEGRPGRGLLRTGAERFGAASFTSSKTTKH